MCGVVREKNGWYACVLVLEPALEDVRLRRLGQLQADGEVHLRQLHPSQDRGELLLLQPKRPGASAWEEAPSPRVPMRWGGVVQNGDTPRKGESLLE